MMGNAMESLLYGLCAVGIVTAVILFCSGIKAACRKILKRKAEK